MTCECGCGRTAAPGGRLAWACYKQLARYGTTRRKDKNRSTRYGSDREMLQVATESFANVSSEDDDAAGRAWRRLLMATLRYHRRLARKRTARNTVQEPTDPVSRG